MVTQVMFQELNLDEMPPEQVFELEAAYGKEAVENGDIVQIDTDQLEPVETPKYRLAEVLEEGDWVTIQHRGGNVTSGPVEDVDTVGFTIDPKNRTAAGYFGYGDFVCEGTDDRGVVNEIIDINGEPADRVIEGREGDN